MQTTRHALLVSMLAGLWSATTFGLASADPVLRMLVFPVPGLFDVADDGRVGGPGAALLAKIGRASDLRLEVVNLPIARALHSLQAESNSCVLGMTRTPEREARYQWVSIITRADFTVYARADSALAVTELGALRGKPVVVLRETVMAAQLREQGVVAQEVTSTLSALRMLQAGRVDYWYSHQLVADSAASAAGGVPIKPVLSTARVDGYLACNLEVPALTVDRLRQAVQKLRNSGDLAEFGLR